MSSKSGWRRFLPGKRKNRREDRVIQAIPISEAGPLLREEETDPETQGPYSSHGQQQYVSSFATHTSSISHI
jgi:hypothetical protein